MEKLLAKSNRIHVFPGSLRVVFKKCQYQQNSGRCSRMSTRRWQFQRLFASNLSFGNTRQSPRWKRSDVTWASSTVSRWLSEHGRLFQNMADLREALSVRWMCCTLTSKITPTQSLSMNEKVSSPQAEDRGDESFLRDVSRTFMMKANERRKNNKKRLCWWRQKKKKKHKTLIIQLPPKVLQHVEDVLRPLAEAWYDHDDAMCQIFHIELGSQPTYVAIPLYCNALAIWWYEYDDMNFELGLGCCLNTQPPMGFAGNHL